MLYVTEWITGLKSFKLVVSGLCIEDFSQQSQNYVATNVATSPHWRGLSATMHMKATLS